jgi:hypothetical protein
VLTFFAQDTGTHNLVYANADVTKATQNREVIAFCDHWKAVSGSDPKMLIMDQKVTTQAISASWMPATSSSPPCGCAHDTPGEIISSGHSITVKINRRAYSPVLRHADLPAHTTVPWWDGRQLRFEFT